MIVSNWHLLVISCKNIRLGRSQEFDVNTYRGVLPNISIVPDIIVRCHNR